MKERVEATHQAVKTEYEKRALEHRRKMTDMKLGEFEVKPLSGKGEQIEKELLELFGDETLGVFDYLFSNWPNAIDAAIRLEMKKRKPNTITELELLE